MSSETEQRIERVISGNRKIKTLCLFSQIDENLLLHFLESLKSNQTLESIKCNNIIEDNTLRYSDNMFEKLCNALKINKHLLSLSFSTLTINMFKLISSLSHNITLRRLELCDCGLNQTKYKILFNFLRTNESITDLIIDKNEEFGNSDDNFCQMLSMNKTLKVISLQQINIKLDNLETLSRGFESNKTLESVNLGLTLHHIGAVRSIGDVYGINRGSHENLYRSLLSNPNLKKLDLSQNFLSTPNMSCLFTILFQNKTLESLDISRNFIIADSIHDLCTMLETNSTLKELKMNQCNLFPSSISSLMESLKRNNGIETLEMGYLDIVLPRSNTFLYQHFDFLYENRTLKNFYLAGNDFYRGDILGFLQFNNTLTDLTIKYTSTKSDELTQLSERISWNKSLKKLDIKFSNGVDASVYIKQMIKFNKSLESITIENKNCNDNNIAIGLVENHQIINCYINQSLPRKLNHLNTMTNINRIILFLDIFDISLLTLDRFEEECNMEKLMELVRVLLMCFNRIGFENQSNRLPCEIQQHIMKYWLINFKRTLVFE